MNIGAIYLNLWAILVAGLSFGIIGALWYSPLLFGKIWMKGIGLKNSDIKKEEANKAMLLSFVPTFVTTFVLAIILSYVGTKTVLDALFIGSLAAIGFLGTHLFNNILFENKSVNVALINLGYALVGYNVMAVILTLWR